MKTSELRPLDQAVQRWVLAHGGSALLADTAARASLADGEGDTVLPLHDLATREALASQALVATDAEEAPTKPFVLDAAGRFYLWRNHADESAVVRAIRARLSHVPPISDMVEIDALLPPAPGVHDQRDALRRITGQRLFVLTGGPGTGKTTTVLRMLVLLQHQASTPLRMALAAPTGKAAQRLAHSLQQGLATLRPLLAEEDGMFDAFEAMQATTVHRLLGYQPWRNGYRHHAGHPVAADVVVVDEASMLDLGMLRALLDAVPPQATLLLVGDADQLPSVGAGSVLRDLVNALDGSPQLAALRHSFRATPVLSALNAAIRSGDCAAVIDHVADTDSAVLTDVGTPAATAGQLDRWADAVLAEPAFAGAVDTPEQAALAIAALGRRQLLCAVRQGPFGVEAANAHIERRMRRGRGVPADALWYAGRIVMITRNEPTLGLFNGDIGVCLPTVHGEWQVWFAGTGEGPVALLPAALPQHETAFAITIHKSQGSEYDHVAVLLPPDPAHRLLNRALLYTAVSRARRHVQLWCTPPVLNACVARPAHRVTALGERLLDNRNNINN